jgi:CRISPR-associated endonuclease/helicase Cas3
LGQCPAAVAACHDVGKVSPGFQLKYFRDYLRKHCPELAGLDLSGFETKHAKISEAAMNGALRPGVRESLLGSVAGAHHGVRDGSGHPDDAGTFGGTAWSKERRSLISCLCERFGPLSESESLVDPHVLAGMVCVADWIGSDERFFPAPDQSVIDQAGRAREAVATCGWHTVRFLPALSFEQVFGFSPHQLQSDFFERVVSPGLYILEAPMGTGKTEAALYAAYRLFTSGLSSGLYFGLPTRLTSDKIHERVQPFLRKIAGDDTAARLAHGNAWIHAFKPGGEALAPGREWFRPSKRALLMPFAVGTIDQALLAVLKVRHFFVRCFGLAGKVVILDEVHSYDVYTGTLLDLLVRRLLEMHCTVIVLSATLTDKRRAALLAQTQPEQDTAGGYPLITAETGTGCVVYKPDPPPGMEVAIQLDDPGLERLAEDVVSRANAGQCVLCIANTVAKAQLWYNQIKAAMPEGAFAIGLLHSKFPVWRRARLEARWTQALGREGPRPDGCVLVATQVVEQSVDIDADLMISELAPTDMLLQHLGRLWRHQRNHRPCAHPRLLIVSRPLAAVTSLEELIEALGKPSSRVYAPYVLWRTYQVWADIRTLALPEDIRPLLEKTYDEPGGDSPDFIVEARADLARRCQKLRGYANTARADVVGFPAMDDNENVSTRYSEVPMLDVVLARSVEISGTTAAMVLSDGEKADVNCFQWQRQAALALHRNLVPVPFYHLPDAMTPKYLTKYFHARTPVLLIADNGDLLMDGNKTCLRYDDERGLQLEQTGQLPGSHDPWSEDPVDIDYDLDHDEMEDALDELDW